MKRRMFAMLCCLCLCLSACGGAAAESEAVSTPVSAAEETERPALEEEEPVSAAADENSALPAVEETTTLVLASQFDETGLEEILAAFTAENPQWQVEEVVLSQEELNLRLAGGDAPDLLDSSYNNYDVLCRNGYLVNLLDYLEADGTMEDFVHLDLVQRPDGLFQFPLNFAMDVVIGLEETYGDYDPWDFAAFTQALGAVESPQQVAGNVTSSSFVARYLRGYCTKYVNYTTGEAQFDTDAFRLLLTTGKAIGMDAEDPDVTGFDANASAVEQFGANPYALMVEYVSALDSTIPLGTFTSLWSEYDGLPVMFRGFPSENGGNGTTLIFGTSLAMCSQSGEQEGAWALIRFAATDVETQASQDSLPIYRPALEQQISDAKLTQEQAETLWSLIDGAADASGYEGTITTLVLEEAELYFANQQDLETTVSAIQSRCTIYLGEQS